MRTTILLVVTADGEHVISYDLTGQVNNNAQSPLLVVVQQKCSLGHWHNMGDPQPLGCWDN